MKTGGKETEAVELALACRKEFVFTQLILPSMMYPDSNRGLAAADQSTRERVARAGGSAPHPHGRGMQRVSPERRREIASKGGRARHG